MPLHKAMAAAFEDEVVILDAEGRNLLLLDVWAARIWSSCEGNSTAAIRSASGGTPERVRETLQALAKAGLIARTGDTWARSPVEWVPIRSLAAEKAVSTNGLVRVTGPSRLCTTLLESLNLVSIPGETLPVLDVTVAADSHVADGMVEGRLVWSIALPAGAPVSVLLGQIVGTLTTLLTRTLFIHAGAVAFAGRGMILVGHSGAGKTSTVAALVRKGAAYLSDEVALLDPVMGTVAPFGLPMAVKPWTRNAAGSLPPGRRIAREAGAEFWLPRNLGGPVAADTFVLLRGEATGPRLTAISPAQMLLAISNHASSFKQQHRVREAFAGFARLLRNARCVALEASRPAAHADPLVALANRLA